MKLKSILSVVAFACLLPATGFADDGDDFTRPGWYLGAGGTWAPHWWHAPEGALNASSSVKTKNSFGFNVRGGYRLKSWLAAELEYEWLDGFDNKVNDSTVFELRTHVVTVNAKLLCPAWSRFQPYLLFGAGAAIFDVNDRNGLGAGLESSSAGFAFRATAGLDVYLTKNWLLNVEAGTVIPTNEVKNSNGDDLEELFYVPIQLGFQYRF
jgi:opacity protein-like surface antigen